MIGVGGTRSRPPAKFVSQQRSTFVTKYGGCFTWLATTQTLVHTSLFSPARAITRHENTIDRASLAIAPGAAPQAPQHSPCTEIKNARLLSSFCTNRTWIRLLLSHQASRRANGTSGARRPQGSPLLYTKNLQETSWYSSGDPCGRHAPHRRQVLFARYCHIAHTSI